MTKVSKDSSKVVPYQRKPPPDVPLVTKMLRKVAERLGASVFVEPEFEYVGLIRFKNGGHTFYRNTNLSINTLGPVEIARDKAYASFFLKHFGYHVPEEQTFFSARWCANLRSKRNADAACRLAKRWGFPVIIKPNNLSQGVLVTKAHTVRELRAAARAILRKTNVFLVQRFIAGRDYRLVVLDDEVISAYERTPLAIAGDGKSSVLRLLRRKQKEFQIQGRDTQLALDDFRIAWTLRRRGLTLASVPPKGGTMRLLDNANLSAGGDSADVTHVVHSEYRDLAVAVTRDMGLRLCGVDLLAPDIAQPLHSSYVILEINAAPGLDHYAAKGGAQEKIVEDLYEKVLRAIEKKVPAPPKRRPRSHNP